MSLDQYLKNFFRLRTDKNRKRWSALTSWQAPHKPFLLLSIMDLIAQGLIAQNFIEPSFELVDTFNTYWNSVMPLGSKTSMAYPFYHMRTEPFWQLMPNGLGGHTLVYKFLPGGLVVKPGLKKCKIRQAF